MPFGKIEPFEVGSHNWDAYCRRVKQFIELNKIDNELHVATLVTHVGTTCYELMCDLCSPDLPEDKTFEQLVKIVKDHLEPQRSEIAERHMFRQRKQSQGEAVSDYLKSLKHLAKHCNFRDTLEVNLRDQFVSGLHSEDMRSRLFAERNIDYKRAIELALALEAAERHAAEAASGATGSVIPEALHRIRPSTARGERGRKERHGERVVGSQAEAAGARAGSAGGEGSRRACWRCGRNEHPPSRCKFRSYTCDSCGLRGHLKVVCRNSDKCSEKYSDSTNQKNHQEEATSPEGGVKERGERERGARGGGGESRSASPASRASPPPDERDIEHSIPATLIQDPNAERESPRCLSRESSGAPRCPSNDSVYSGRSAPSLPLPAALSAALPAALPAALLPPHSAAVAAYLGAAAAAAQQRLLMSCQEDMTDSERADAVLDFSTKRSESPIDDEDDDAVNLTKNENGPLDLSVGTRKRAPEDTPSPVPTRKSSRTSDFKPISTPWTTPVAPHLPYFAAAVAAASLSPKGGLPHDWNGKLKHGTPTPNDATKALEKMSELSRLGGEELFRSVQSAALGAGLTPNAAARHSAWQSHWLNKGADQTKDVLKCVWCKKSFNSLADLTVHMKEAKHCGVNVPVPPSGGGPILPSLLPPSSSPSTPSHNSSSSSGSSKPNHNDLNMLIKENMPIPRKLVRGQDVWLGKGAEQTRQILKCMWCAESFRSLAEMTSHMQRTQHYTNIISQEQIISWKSSDEAKGSNSSTPGTNNAVPPATGTSSHVSAVLTCKVCDQAFSSLKELSNHMVKNSHYKEHIMRSITESGGRRRQTREKRKKSLPVRKLLELERAQHEFKNGEGNGVPMGKPIRDFGAGSRITCEKCGDKIETAVFVEHIRQCIGAPMSNSQRNFLKSALLSNNIIPPDVPGHITPTSRDGRKSINDEVPSPGSTHHRSPSSVNDSSPSSKDHNPSNEKSSSPSVLNAIEQLIEKSFDTRSRHSVPGMPGGASHAPIGSSILKRLGIDESVDYTKPLVDAQTMSMLRNYHHQQGYGRRERSGSESSSMSERGGSRVESLTPDRKLDSYHMTPRTTPDTRGSQTPASEDRPAELRIKKEITDEEDRDTCVDLSSQPVRVKTEVDDDEEHARPNSAGDEDVKPTVPKRESEGPSPVPSPRSPASDRSAPTPGADRKPASSLGALSSMFDSLAGGGSSNEPSSSRRGGSHPLAALQKLCDKTETNSSRAPPPAPSPAGPPSILTFSWACNDAVVTDSIMKCALCDTPFISKGAYRHHLSKMHFVKDGALPEPVPVKAPPPAASPGAHKSSGSNAASPQDPRSPSQSFDESPHSKFLKYTELAKQLSSKYV